MASINLGVVGCIAASAAGSAPTGVSIGTTSSGNYDNAVIAAELGACGSHDYFDLSGGTLSGNVSVASLLLGYDGCDTAVNTRFKGYIRATGATSFLWGLAFASTPSLSNGCSAAINGTASTDQDETSGHIGKYLTLTFGGGRGGITGPTPGEDIQITISADATNSNGTTSATDVDIVYTFIT